MPYSSEHSARVKDPSLFKNTGWSRTSVKGETGLDKIMGHLKDPPAGDPPVIQAYRFKKNKWTVAEAKKWLKDHNIKYIRFEPASEDYVGETEDWFRIENKGTNSGEIYIMGEIWDRSFNEETVTPTWFQKELKKLKDITDLHIFVNSGGGSVIAGLAIHNMIKNSKVNVTTHIMGLAASTASWMIMPSDKIIMPENAFMMLHLPAAPAFGNKNDLRKTADLLERIEEVINISYMRGGTKPSSERITELLDSEGTWLNGKEALEEGLVDELEPEVNVVSKIDGSSIIMNGITHDLNKFPNFPVSNLEPNGHDLDKYFDRFKLLNTDKTSNNLDSYKKRIEMLQNL